MARTPRTPGEAPKVDPVADVQEAAVPQAVAAHEVGELPDEKDVDPTKIARAVLTKQGWVCPAKAPGGI